MNIKNKFVPFFILLLMLVQFSFGFYKIQKEAYVDEALWLYNRIPKFWQNIGERDWNGTRRSDKPGVTVMYATGIGLLNSNNLINCKDGCPDTAKLERMLIGFRTPILILTTLFIPLLFFLLQKLFTKKTALLSTTLVALSPILLGMSRIINPDALLWAFSTGVILSYLVFFKNPKNNKFLYLSGILMGLTIATKYVSNILFIFILILIFLNYIFSRKNNLATINDYFKKHILSYLKFIAISIATFTVIYPAVWVKQSRILKATLLSQAFKHVWKLYLIIIFLLLIDTFLLRNRILKLLLDRLKKYQLFLKKIVSIVFLVFIAIIFVNISLPQPFFDFGYILGSPKSSFGRSEPFFFYLTNFYPLLFGIAPIALLAIIWKFVKTIIQKKNNSKTSDNVFFYFSFLILLYYLASLFAKVAGTIRYQIILYPLILIMAGIAISEILSKIKFFKNQTHKYAFYLIFLAFLILPLYQIKPFYMSYSSVLLPEKYFLDHKDMGSGSYEAAQYLNSLPDAEHLTVWSDKKGVCVFFVGYCNTRFKSQNFQKQSFDYYVVSSGRKNLAIKRIATIKKYHPEILPIDKLYDYTNNNYSYIIKLGNRASGSVRIFKSENIAKQ